MGHDRLVDLFLADREVVLAADLGKQEAQLITIACSDAPEGRDRWTLKMLANKMVRLEYVDTISPSTVQRTLKKTK